MQHCCFVMMRFEFVMKDFSLSICRIVESCQEAFILRLYRQKNKVHEILLTHRLQIYGLSHPYHFDHLMSPLTI